MNELTNEKLYDVIVQWKAICQKELELNGSCRSCPVLKVCCINGPEPATWDIKEEDR